MENYQINRQKNCRTHGFTLIEMLVVIFIIAVLTGLGVVSYLNARSPANEAKNALNALLFQTRAEAAGKTQARRLRISPQGDRIFVETSTRCDGTGSSWAPDPQVVELPNKMASKPLRIGLKVPESPTDDVLVCFTSRGLVHRAKVIVISDTKSTYEISLSLTGGVKINEI